MYERWDAKRCRMRTAELLDEQLFCDLYDTLKEITVEYLLSYGMRLLCDGNRYWQRSVLSWQLRYYKRSLQRSMMRRRHFWC